MKRVLIACVALLLFASPLWGASYEARHDTVVLISPSDTAEIDYRADHGFNVHEVTIRVVPDTIAITDTLPAVHFSTRLDDADSVTNTDYRLEAGDEPYFRTNADIEFLSFKAGQNNNGDVTVWIRAKSDFRHRRTP